MQRILFSCHMKTTNTIVLEQRTLWIIYTLDNTRGPQRVIWREAICKPIRIGD